MAVYVKQTIRVCLLSVDALDSVHMCELCWFNDLLYHILESIRLIYALVTVWVSYATRINRMEKRKFNGWRRKATTTSD